MANVPSTFPFLVGSPDPDQAEERAGGTDFFPGPNTVPLITGPATRYWPLYDNTTRTIRMWKSTNGGKTWTQKNSASAPVMPANGTGPAAVGIWQYYNVAWDLANTIYVVGWSSTWFIALFPFNTLTDAWGAPIISGLTYLDQTVARAASGFGGFMAAYRPVDGAVWMAFEAGGQDATDCETIWGAKCIPGGAGWDGALTRLGGVYQDGLFHTTGSMTCDLQTSKIHLIYQQCVFGIGGSISVTVAAHVITDNAIIAPGAGYPFPLIPPANDLTTTGNAVYGGFISVIGGHLAIGHASAANDGTVVSNIGGVNGPCSFMHRVINTNDSLTAEQTVFVGPNAISVNLGNLKVSDGVMSFTFLIGGGSFSVGGRRKVMRALIGDAPAWEITEPVDANVLGDGTQGFQPMETVRKNGQDYLFFGYTDHAGNDFFSFSTSMGIGFAWSSETNFAFFDNGLGPAFANAGVVAPVGALAIGMPAGSDWGWGYWEVALAPAAGVGAKGPQIQIVPFPIKHCLGRVRDLVHCVLPSKDGKIYVPVKTALLDKGCC